MRQLRLCHRRFAIWRWNEWATKITLVQAVQLARSLKKLLGKSGDTIDPLGEIKNILGVDSINVTNSADNYDTLVTNMWENNVKKHFFYPQVLCHQLS